MVAAPPPDGARGAPADFLQEGDIVLFKGKRAVDAGMRWFMKSEYNHSALVVNVHGELQLFEATARASAAARSNST